MHGLKTQVTEAKEGSFELRKNKAKITGLREEEGVGGGKAQHAQRESIYWILCVKGFYLFSEGRVLEEVAGEDLNRIFCAFLDLELKHTEARCCV